MSTIECKDVILREFLVEDVDAIYNLTQQPHIIEFLPEWSVPKEQRLNWLTNYETVENRQFINAVADGADVGQLRLIYHPSCNRDDQLFVRAYQCGRA